MMGKKLRNLALLGGLGAAAYMMGSKKGDSKKDLKIPLLMHLQVRLKIV
jgi:hypothetical protein